MKTLKSRFDTNQEGFKEFFSVVVTEMGSEGYWEAEKARRKRERRIL